MRLSASFACFLTTALAALGAGTSSAGPQVFWASDPVRPNETVLLQGNDFGSAAVVEVSRWDDAMVTAPTAEVEAKSWTRVPVLQASDCSLKFVVPADWKMGVFACRVTAGGATSAPVLVNAPDPWWVQGDRGASATPGGWLRIFGKSLSFACRRVGEARETSSNGALREPVQNRDERAQGADSAQPTNFSAVRSTHATKPRPPKARTGSRSRNPAGRRGLLRLAAGTSR